VPVAVLTCSDHITVKLEGQHRLIIGVGQYGINEGSLTAEIALVIRDDYQNRGVGAELLSYMAYIARKQGLLGFTAEVLPERGLT
jgi:GNAT superfamily N-acetyltransferase